MASYEEKINYIIKEVGWLPMWEDDFETIDFYYTCFKEYGFSLYDTDEYANLNQIIGYDIGHEMARKISDWYYVNEDISVLEFGKNDKEKLLAKLAEIAEEKGE